MRNLAEAIEVAKGKRLADLVMKNASFVNVFNGEIDHGDVAIYQGYIVGIGSYKGETEVNVAGRFLLPGLIDSHIHLESSLVMPEEFARGVLCHGTTTVVADPHEIANVMGTDGIKLMLEATENIAVDVAIMLPSCVPASSVDESGAQLHAEDLKPFYQNPRVLGLAEMMDYPSVISGEEGTMNKIYGAQETGGVIDGHAPFLTGRSLQAYIAAGIASDHECVHLWEAKEKLRFGQHIMIREGTAARNLDALAPVITPQTVHRCMFCTDDKHPNHLVESGHIDMILRKAVSLGVDPVLAVKAATFSPACYFGMKEKGAIASNYIADMIIVNNLTDFKVESVYKKGELVYNSNGKEVLPAVPNQISPELLAKAENTVKLSPTAPEDFINIKECGVLGIVPGEILTTHCNLAKEVDVEKDILKISVLERHRQTGHRGIGFLKGYGLKEGAIASSIAHDSHNIIVVGVTEEDMSVAVNALISMQGGIVVVNQGVVKALLPLPVAGIMSKESVSQVTTQLEEAKQVAYAQGVSPENDPFMTLSFLSLPVIPTLRLTTRGVYDVISGEYLSM
ncbi:MAG: adenine deaminase [Eubacteriales bacterium]